MLTCYASAQELLVLGDPWPLALASLNKLPHALREVEAVEAAWREQGRRSFKFCEQDATLGALLHNLPAASWVHLACHGGVTKEWPTGALFLADKGILTPDKLISSALHMPAGIRARAVLLSACEGGSGQALGESLVGFNRALLLLGVPVIVAPLWKVHSLRTELFMKALYKELATSVGMAEALQCVMCSAICGKLDCSMDNGEKADWQVNHWAAFCCVGFPGVKFA